MKVYIVRISELNVIVGVFSTETAADHCADNYEQVGHEFVSIDEYEVLE